MCLVLRRRYGMKVTVLVATRGEGGQNAVGPELGLELRRIRTEETEAAARRLDVGLSFLELPDFGYCRTAAEALDRWRSYRPRERLEQKLAELRPDLVLTPHLPGEPHGQKRAVFHLLTRVMQGRDLRFFHLVDRNVETPSLELDLDHPDPDVGATYREMAYETLLLHRTQGPHQSLEEEVRSPIRLRSASGRSPVSLHAGLPSIWDQAGRLSKWLTEQSSGMTVEELESELGRLPRTYDLSRGIGKCTRLLGALRLLAKRATGDLEARLLQRVRALERAVLAQAVHESLVGPEEWEGSEHLELQWRVFNRGPEPLRLSLDGLSPESSRSFRIVTPEAPEERADASDREKAGILIPSRELGELPIRVSRSSLAGKEAWAMLELSARLEIGGTEVPLRTRRGIRFVEPLVLEAEPESRFLVPTTGGELPFSLRFEKPRSRSIRGFLAMTGPQGFRFLPESDRETLPILVELPVGAKRQSLFLRVVVPEWLDRGDPRPRRVTLRFYLVSPGTRAPIPGSSCMVQVDPVDIRVPRGIRIGLLQGPDDTVKRTLDAFDLDVRELDERSVPREALDRYHTLLVDSRALLRRKDLLSQVSRLLAYVRRGGHLVVLYHKAQEFNRDEIGVLLAPYPLVLGRQRITREDAPIRALRPGHVLLEKPNRIAPEDWDGWVQERGLYFPRMGSYDRRYEELLSIREVPLRESEEVAAPAQVLEFEAQRGGLLYAEYGAGSYVYCSLVLHRQLRIYHHGAARLLVNLVTPPGWEEFR